MVDKSYSFDATDKTEEEVKQYYHNMAKELFDAGEFIPRDKDGNFPEGAYLLVMERGAGVQTQVVGADEDMEKLIRAIILAKNENETLKKAFLFALLGEIINLMMRKDKPAEDAEDAETTDDAGDVQGESE